MLCASSTRDKIAKLVELQRESGARSRTRTGRAGSEPEVGTPLSESGRQAPEWERLPWLAVLSSCSSSGAGLGYIPWRCRTGRARWMPRLK